MGVKSMSSFVGEMVTTVQCWRYDVGLGSVIPVAARTLAAATCTANRNAGLLAIYNTYIYIYYQRIPVNRHIRLHMYAIIHISYITNTYLVPSNGEDRSWKSCKSGIYSIYGIYGI